MSGWTDGGANEGVGNQFPKRAKRPKLKPIFAVRNSIKQFHGKWNRQNPCCHTGFIYGGATCAGHGDFLSNLLSDNNRTYAISAVVLSKSAGRGNLPGLPVTLEECLEALGILPEKQAAKPERHL